MVDEFGPSTGVWGALVASGPAASIGGCDHRACHRRRPACRGAPLRARLAAGGAGGAARFRRRRAGGRLAGGRRLAAGPDPGQRRGAQARRQDRRGGARQAPGGDQGPGRADRQGPGEDRSRGPPPRRDRPADPHPAGADGADSRQPQLRDRRPEEGPAPAADPRPVGGAAAAPLRRDRRHDRARRLRAAGDAADRGRQPAPRRALPPARGPQLRRRLQGAARRLPRRPGGRRSNPSAGSTSSATRARPASTSARSARRTTRGSSRPARCRTW